MVAVALTLFLLAGLPQAAGQEGTVSGTLTLNGRTVALAHVYASAGPGFFDKTTEDIRVLLSDAPLPDSARADVFDLMKLAREGRASIVEVVIDASGAPISGAFFAKEFNGMVSATGMHVFSRSEMAAKRVAGRLATGNPRTFDGVTFQYDATFAAPIPRPLTPEERAASFASSPAVAASAYVAALTVGRWPDFLKTMTSAAARDYQGPAGAERFRQLRAGMPPDSRVVELIPQTNGTVLVTLEGHEGTLVIAYTLTMAIEAGEWKVTK